MRHTDEILELPNEYLIEIGRVTVRWAFLESILDLCLIKLAGLNVQHSTSLVIFNHMTFPLKIDVLGALITERKPFYKFLEAYASDVEPLLKKAQEKRNTFIHSKWGLTSNGEVHISRIQARGALKTSVRPIALEEIEAASSLIYDAAEALHDLVTNTKYQPSIPRTKDSK